MTDFAEVEEMGYWDRGLAAKRARHLWEQDGVYACIWPVKFWAPPAPVIPPQIPIPNLTVGAATTDEGMKLHAYAEDKKPRLKQARSRMVLGRDVSELAASVGAAWRAWALDQAEQGNIYEAGQELPSEECLTQLFSGPTLGSIQQPAQLQLPGIS